MFRTVYDEQGRSCVEFDEGSWAEATFTDYLNGIEIVIPRR